MKTGDIVTLEYNSLSRNQLPVSPIITRVREDVHWDHVVADYVRSVPHRKNLNGKPSPHFTLN